MSKVVRFGGCELSSEDGKSKSFEIRNVVRKISQFPDTQRFEAEVYLSLFSLLSNKMIKVVTMNTTPSGFELKCSIEDGVFEEIVRAQPEFEKFLCIDSSLFSSFIDTAQAFYKSLIAKDVGYSIAFALMIFSLENMANRVYPSKQRKASKLVKFVKKYVSHDRFEKNEIRQLEFTDSNQLNMLFKRLLIQSYRLRCDFVHETKQIPALSQIADRLALAFVSNDYVSLFPSYGWLRRIAHIALTTFLSQEEYHGKNSMEDYFDENEIGRFTAKRAIQKGQFVTENDVYLQRLKDFSTSR
jgi:hypothetical protein